MRTCLLCGDTGPGVRVALVAWRVPIDRRPFEAIPRCADHVACRVRCEAAGDKWPVLERPKRGAA